MKRTWVLLVVVALAVASCGRKAEHQAKAPASKLPPFSAELSMKDLMNHAIDPASDVVWAASGTVVDERGTTDLSPKTKDGWKMVANNAAILSELANVLMLPGRAPGDPEWNQYANQLHNAAIAAMRAAERQDKAGLFRTGGDVYDACTACHKRYVLGER